MPRDLRLYLGLAISALFIALLLRRVDGGELLDAVGAARPAWLLLAALPYAAGLWLRALRWRLVLWPALRIRRRDACALLLLGYAANNVLPARAGELVRTGLLQRRHGASWALGLGTIVVERVLDGLVLTAFLAATVALAGGGPLLRWLAALAALGFLTATALLALAAARPAAGLALAARLLRPVLPRARERPAAWLAAFAGGLATLRDGPTWGKVLALSAASWALEGTAYWLIGRAFGLALPLPLYAAVVAAANLALVAPSTAGGIGPFEFFARETVVAYGTAAAAGTAYAIALHLLTLVPVALAALVVLWRLDLGLRTLAPPAPPAGAEASPRA